MQGCSALERAFLWCDFLPGLNFGAATGLQAPDAVDLEVNTPLVADLAQAQWSIWDSGEWWMLLAAQSMAVGTVMVRYVSQYADPVVATGYHMLLGGLPLLALSLSQESSGLAERLPLLTGALLFMLHICHAYIHLHTVDRPRSTEVFWVTGRHRLCSSSIHLIVGQCCQLWCLLRSCFKRQPHGTVKLDILDALLCSGYWFPDIGGVLDTPPACWSYSDIGCSVPYQCRPYEK